MHNSYVVLIINKRQLTSSQSWLISHHILL